MEAPLFKRLRLEGGSFDLTEDDEQEIAFPGGLSMADTPPAAAAAAAAFPPFDERVLAAAAACRQRDAANAAAAERQRDAAAAAAAAARPRRVLSAERIEAIRVRIRDALRVHARGYGRALAERFAHDDLVCV